ncbi:MAG: helix-turn-helix transcriptional regulator [Planctomycetes bacterium]|nr:helix-turn-helix transcriptional regulator [Planctomycetota bacterium]
MKQKTDIATFVRELRHALDLTQEEFAAKLGVAFPTVNRWENGRVEPSPLGLKQLKDVLRRMGKMASNSVCNIFPVKIGDHD